MRSEAEMMDGEAHDDGGPWMLRRLNPEPGVGHGSKVPGDGLIHRRSRDYMEVGYVELQGILGPKFSGTG